MESGSGTGKQGKEGTPGRGHCLHRGPRWAHAGHGPPGTAAGAPTREAVSGGRAAWASPPHPDGAGGLARGRRALQAGGQRARGRRDVISADQAPAPTALREKRSFPQLRKILFAGRKKGNPESLYSRPRCSHSLTVGAGPPRPRGPSPTEDTQTPIPTRDAGRGPRGLDREHNPPVHAKATPGDRSHS